MLLSSALAVPTEELHEIFFLCGPLDLAEPLCRKAWMVELAGPQFSSLALYRLAGGHRVTHPSSIKRDISACLAGGLKSMIGKALRLGPNPW